MPPALKGLTFKEILTFTDLHTLNCKLKVANTLDRSTSTYYLCSMGSGQIFATALRRSPLDVFNKTTQTTPSLPGYSS